VKCRWTARFFIKLKFSFGVVLKLVKGFNTIANIISRDVAEIHYILLTFNRWRIDLILHWNILLTFNQWSLNLILHTNILLTFNRWSFIYNPPYQNILLTLSMENIP
jgi:hypothetical protein